MFLVRHNVFLNIRCIARFISNTHKTCYYDVLQLPKNCTNRAIKEAFFRLSKKFHPDVNKSISAKTKYLQIVEAYNVLGKKLSRDQYDNSIEIKYSRSPRHNYRAGNPNDGSYHSSYSGFRSDQFTSHRHYGNSTEIKFSRPSRNHYKAGNVKDGCVHSSYSVFSRQDSSSSPYYGTYGGFRDSSFYQYRDHTKDSFYASKPFHGSMGVKRVPNSNIVMWCISFMILGVVIQLALIINMYKVNRRKAHETSKNNAKLLETLRTTSEQNGNELQVELLLQKIIENSRNSISTASMAQEITDMGRK